MPSVCVKCKIKSDEACKACHFNPNKLVDEPKSPETTAPQDTHVNTPEVNLPETTDTTSPVQSTSEYDPKQPVSLTNIPPEPTTKEKKKLTALIRDRLQIDDKWLLRGLLVIYSFQTEAEKNTHATQEWNGMGFSKFDANFLSAMAVKTKQAIAYNNPSKITPKMLKAIRKGMNKYAGQLMRVAVAKSRGEF